MFQLRITKLFSVLYGKPIVLSETVKFGSETKERDSLGVVIKKLNKENKSLFGDLLETRPQKRKRESKNLLASTSSSSGTNSEAWWYGRLQPSLSRKWETNVSKPDLSHQTVNNNITQNCSRNSVEYPVAVGPTSAKTNAFTKGLTKKDKQQLVDTNTSPNDLVLMKSAKINELILPDIIVRNITSFPLQNRIKDSKDTYTDSLSILSIQSSRSDNKESKKLLTYPSVSKILNATMSDASRAALKRWREKLIADLGEEGFLVYYRGLLDKGSQFHSAVHDFLSGTQESDLKLDQIEGCWESLRNVVPDITDVRVLESHVVHSDLLYRGVIDCVASYRGKPVLIEWKKSDKQKTEIEKTYDAPIQLSAYVGAMNFDNMYNIEVHGGLVVVAYNDGTPANTFKMNMAECHKYWRLWLYRMQKYWLQQQQQPSGA